MPDKKKGQSLLNSRKSAFYEDVSRHFMSSLKSHVPGKSLQTLKDLLAVSFFFTAKVSLMMQTEKSTCIRGKVSSGG